MDSIRGWGERIVNHFAGTTGFDQTRPAQVGKVPGDFRLWNLQDALELANAVLPLGEEVQQSQAG